MHRLAGFFLVAFASACAGAPLPKPLPQEPAPHLAETASAEPPPEPPPEPVADRVPEPETPPPAPTAETAAKPHYEPLDPDVRAAFADANLGKTGAFAKLRKSITRIDKDANLEDRMLAHALLGRQQRLAGKTARAKKEYDQVIAAWGDPAASVQSIAGDPAEDPVALPRLGLALTALGEAYFAAAEEKRSKAMALRPPHFGGPATDTAIKRYLAKDVADWMRKRRVLDEEAEAAYRKVLDIQPLPPPRWVIASAAQVGELLESLPSALEKVPVPPSIAKSPDLVAAYRDAIKDATAPMRERAKAAYRACQQYSEKYVYADAYSNRCKERLANMP